MKQLPHAGLGLAALLIVLSGIAPLASEPTAAARLPGEGAAPWAASPNLVISEVLFDCAGTEPNGEWIELYNAGCSTIDLSNYKVGDEVSADGTEGMTRFPSGASIAPDQAIVIANRASAFFANHGLYPDYEMIDSEAAVPDMENYTAWTDGSVRLDNDGDDVLVLDAADHVVDGLSWGTSSYFFSPAAPDVAQGHTLERWPADGDSNAAADWLDQAAPGPGEVFLGPVTSSADCGPGTLRLHLLHAAPGDSITFDQAAFPPADPVAIWVQSPLPALTRDNLTVGGSGAGVILDGSLAPRGTSGLAVRAGHCTLQGLTVQHFSGSGIVVQAGAAQSQIVSNTLAFNGHYGISIETCAGNTLSRNKLSDNVPRGIQSGCPAPPEIAGVHIDTDETVTGTTVPDARVEFFSDDGAQGQIYEGFTTADAAGVFTFTRPGGFAGPNVTATSTDPAGNTSEFSPPTRLLWTLLLYLNGDNDLQDSMFNTLSNTLAAGPSPRANVLVLLDGYTTTAACSGTVLYDVTEGQATVLSTTLTITGERNMGDGQTLVDFVTWGRAHYPARYTMLSILDHGGGWAPSGSAVPPGALPIERKFWSAGKSGLSWDFSSDYDHLDSGEIRQAMAAITSGSNDPLDVVFYDVCLMGMVEVAYQIQGYADYLVSSQNIGWAPVGPDERYDHRYIETIRGITATTQPTQLAQILVNAYADTLPPKGHPFTIAALDLTLLPTVTGAIDDLSLALSQTLTGPEPAMLLHRAYSESQKIDYDSDLQIEPSTEGFVDLFDLALHLSQQYTDPAVLSASQALSTALDAAIVAERHQSGVPWIVWDPAWDLEEVFWDLDNVHGLSIFMPLGEDLELPIPISASSPISPGLFVTRSLRLRDLYTCEELQFVCDTSWEDLIHAYYEAASSLVPTDTTAGPVRGLLPVDVTPPHSTMVVSGSLDPGVVLSVTWVATDTQSGIDSVILWHRPSAGPWAAALTQTGTAGVFPFTLLERCDSRLAVRATDRAGNVEALDSGENAATVGRCLYLPLVLREFP